MTVLGFLIGSALAAEPVDRSFELSPIDLPSNLGHGLPSMDQATEITADTYELGYLGTDALAGLIVDVDERPVLGQLARFAISAPIVYYGSEWPVPTATWLHEEFHRSSLAHGDVASRNGNSPALWQGIVFGVDDADLAAMKEADPVAFVRAHASGLEAEDALARTISRSDFFRRDRSSKPAVLLWTAYHGHLYLALSAGPVSDDITNWNLEHQSEDPLKRDYVGLDPTAWVYDLSRPDEPYADRGDHPYLEGLKRPIGWSDLTSEEQDFLALQERLAWLDFANPAAFGAHRFRVPGRDLWFNAMAQHTLTSFGYVLSFDVLVAGPESGLVVAYKHQRNAVATFPGLEVEVVGLPVPVGDRVVRLSPRATLFTQPEDQGFRTRVHQPGAVAGLRADVPVDGIVGAYVDLEAKSAGWVPTNVFLGPNVSGRAGVAVAW